MKLLPLAVAALSGKARSRLTGLTATAKVMALFGGCAAVSIFFLLTAVTIFLSREFGAITACLLMSAIFAIGAGIVLMIHARRQRQREMVKMQRLAAVSSAESATEAGVTLLLQAFLRGFLGGRR